MYVYYARSDPCSSSFTGTIRDNAYISSNTYIFFSVNCNWDIGCLWIMQNGRGELARNVRVSCSNVLSPSAKFNNFSCSVRIIGVLLIASLLTFLCKHVHNKWRWTHSPGGGVRGGWKKHNYIFLFWHFDIHYLRRMIWKLLEMFALVILTGSVKDIFAPFGGKMAREKVFYFLLVHDSGCWTELRLHNEVCS